MTGWERQTLRQLIDEAKRLRLERTRRVQPRMGDPKFAVSYETVEERREARRRSWRESQRRRSQRIRQQREEMC